LPDIPTMIDADYGREVRVPTIELGQGPVRIEHGMRIARMLVAPVPRIVWELVQHLPESERGSGGGGWTHGPLTGPACT